MTQPFHAKSMAELPDLNALAARSGLEFLQDVLNGTLAQAPIGDTLNFWPIAVENGRVTFEGAPQFDSVNPLRTVHGGWYGAILDSCMGCAVQSTLPKGKGYTTLEFKVNILRSIPLGMTVTAVGTVQHTGRSTGVATAELRGKEDGRLYATGSTTCIVLTLPSPAG
ncbi:MAG: PaaI family thioesterase [Pelagimonas sp.]|jgi:uncharacterized protein (TIGR00369 family)|nr:PaaI family thioesterase [Pelagimonas sp.]